MRNRIFKVVKTNQNNSDEELMGFYASKREAAEDIPHIVERHKSWIKDASELYVKYVDPELIANMVSTDIMHYVCSLIPDEDWARVVQHSDAGAEIQANFLMCGGKTYYYLSRIVPKDWTVVDIGASYGAQSYLFLGHKRYIAVEPFRSSDDWHFENFKADGTERYKMTAGKFIKDVLPTLSLDLGKTFAICNYVPEWFGENPMELVRQTFHNCYVYYP